MNKIAVVTGANRGIGFGVAKALAQKGFHVILTSRDVQKGQKATEDLSSAGLDVSYFKLDVIDEEDIKKLYHHIKSKFNRIDVLINNAGVLVTGHGGSLHEDSALKASSSGLRKSFEVNTIGPFLMCQYFIPLMIENNFGRIVNVGSKMGQLSSMGTGAPGYRLSKLALNGVSLLFANELKSYNILINTGSPGWVKTDMGGPNAPRTIEEGIQNILWLATLPDGGPSGLYFEDMKQGEW